MAGCAGSSLLCELFSSCSEQGLLSRCAAWASPCGGFCCCRAQALDRWLRGCGAQAWLLHRTCCLPGPGIEPESSALAGGLFITEPPGKPSIKFQHLFRSPGILVEWVAPFLGCHSTLPRSHVTWSVMACCGCGRLGHETEFLKKSSKILLCFSTLTLPLCSPPDFPLNASYAVDLKDCLRKWVTVPFIWIYMKKYLPKGWYSGQICSCPLI